jgi:hypothetical protein
MNQHPTFEETYPKHEFAELVRLGLVIGQSVLRLLRSGKAQWPSAPALDRVSPTQA